MGEERKNSRKSPFLLDKAANNYMFLMIMIWEAKGKSANDDFSALKEK